MKGDKKLIVICGPTASGKTELAIKLAKKFNGVIISADSRQIYREMDIATAKPWQVQNSKFKTQGDFYTVDGIKHYMLNLVRPDQEFTLAQYQKQVFKILNKIYQENQKLKTKTRPLIPFLVGGTGLYIKSIVDGLTIPKVAPNKKLRMELEKETNADLCKKLEQLDPELAETIDKNNKRRLIRALEVCLLTGKPFSQQKGVRKTDLEVLQIGIDIPRQELYRRIDQRVDEMIKKGLIDETKNLLKKYHPHLPSMSGIGYREIIRYLNKEITLEEAKTLIKYRTHALARRQLTWFRRDKRIHWIKNFSESEKLIKKFLDG